MTEPIDAPLNEPAAGEYRGATGVARSLGLVLEIVRGQPGGSAAWKQQADQIMPSLETAMGTLELEARAEILPLLGEVLLSVRSTEVASKDLRAALTGALEPSMQQLEGEARGDWLAAQILAIADLRSARGAACLNILSDTAAAAAETAPTAPDNTQLPAVLAEFRKSLLALLRADGAAGAKGLAAACRRLEAFGGANGAAHSWRGAAQLFDRVEACGAAHHVSVRRVAVRLEKRLRRVMDGAAATEPMDPPGRLEADLELLSRVLPRAYARAEAAGLPVPVDVEIPNLETVLDTLLQSPEIPGGLAAARDALLMQARFDDWLTAWKLEQAAAAGNQILAAVEVWAGTALPPIAEDPGSGLDAVAENQLEQAGALLKRFDEAVAEIPAAAESAVPEVRVDEALLEHLNLAAAEIRGARSKAEANLGSFRGGLENMERTIKSLRSQLEALEVDSSASVDAAGPARQAAAGMPAKLGALSRGIEELSGLKDALQALTEETESVLAGQAGEDAELEQGLLRTRLVPIGGQFESWSQWVTRAAVGWGVAATLSPRGGEVMLERGHAEALSRALKPMLEACVRNGLTGSASPARINPDNARLEVSVSQAKLDVRVDLSYTGAPLAAAALADLKPGFDAFGAVCGSRVDARGKTRFSVLVPGPPRPMDLLLMDLGERRVGLSVEGVAGVCRPAVAVGDEVELLTFEDQRYRVISLAEILGWVGADQRSSMCVLLALGDQRLACVVDTVVGRERLLVRSPGPLLWTNPWVLGAVIDDLAAPTLVLDPDAIRRCASEASG